MSFKFIILGCGSSLGVPRIDGYFGQCDPNNKKMRWLHPSIVTIITRLRTENKKYLRGRN